MHFILQRCETMKRIFSFALSLVFVMTLTACGNSANQGTDTTPSSNVATTESVITNSTTETESSSQKAENNSSDGLRADFKKAMDSYEKFMNEYVAFMKKYNDNPSDLALLSDYAKFMSDYAEFVEDFEKWENEDLNAAEFSYYAEVQTRVSKKLLEVTQ